jgi:hypothetical protein
MSSRNCKTCGVNPISKGHASQCRICSRKNVESPSLTSSVVGMAVASVTAAVTDAHLYLLTSPAHEMIQKFKIGVTSGSLEELIAECKPYMMEVTVHRFNRITDLTMANKCLGDLIANLAQYKTDCAGWFESKKDTIIEIFDERIREIYMGLDKQFADDLNNLSHAISLGADKLELRIKLGCLNESGKKYLKSDI